MFEKGELEDDIREYYATFMASIFRSVRFGVSSSHGKANMIRFNFFEEKGIVGDALQADLDRLTEAGIPVDIIFEY